MADEPAIIIKRVKKGGHGGHHGGAWKVAYADFVTAMMAFFLLMWLLNATSEEQKRGIADYFSPTPGLVKGTTGGDGFFSGRTIGADGAMITAGARPSVTIPLPSTESSASADDEEPSDDQSAAADSPASKDIAEADAAKKLAEIEDQKFAEAEKALRQAIQNIPELQRLAKSLIIDKTPEGLRIQIVDQERYAMFPLGSTKMHDDAKKLMGQVAKVIKFLPNDISITGHTDATPYVNPDGYDNWDLSTDRANASRRALIDAGLPPQRIVQVTGRADTEPLIADNPRSPRNRRISIVLLRKQKPPPGAESAEAGAPAPNRVAPDGAAPPPDGAEAAPEATDGAHGASVQGALTPPALGHATGQYTKPPT